MTLYADSSALLKPDVAEPDSERAVEMLAGDTGLVTARHTPSRCPAIPPGC